MAGVCVGLRLDSVPINGSMQELSGQSNPKALQVCV